MLTIGSLFAGIGGFDLGLELAGMHVAWQVEIDPFCRSVLAKHWPNVRRYPDVHFVGAFNLEPVDVLCGGFPCQDLSAAGKRAGIERGERSSLWREFRRLVGELRPRWVIIENVYRGWASWVPFVRGDLGRLGYASLPLRLRASDFGAPHERARCFVIAAAHPDDQRELCERFTEPQRWANEGWRRPSDCAWWMSEPCVDRVVHGILSGMDRRARPLREKALGNAIVPQAAEWIGRVIMEVFGA